VLTLAIFIAGGGLGAMADGSLEAAGGAKRFAHWLSRTRLTAGELWRMALGFAVAVSGSLAFLYLKLPLPWFLGSLTFCLVAAVLNAPIAPPKVLSTPMRAVLGVAVGTAFTPALMANAGGMLGSLAAIVPFMILIMLIGTVFFERYARFDRPTAFFCAVPGGLTDMVTMAADAGANTRAVTLIQATRIVMIVFLLPFWLQWVGGASVATALPPGTRFADLLFVDALVLLALAWVGWRLAVRLGLAGAPLIGPMILSGVAHATGLTAARVPVELLIFAQMSFGIMLGTQFRGLTFREFSTTMIWGIAFSLVLTIVTAVVALVVSRVTGFDSTSVLLAYAPGGQTELNLLAYVLGLDAAFTALHHLVRLAVVIFSAQIVFAANKSWRNGSG
jgi:membrane AbrB-like protein